MRLAPVALLLTACSARVDQVAVHLEGVRDVPESRLRGVIEVDKLKAPASASDRAEVVKRDELYLLAALYDQGYVQAKVGSRTSVADDGALDVTYRVDEGPRFRLRAVSVHERGSTSALATLRRTKVGDWFSRRSVIEDLAELRTQLGQREITPLTNVDEKARAIDLDLVVER